METAAAIALVRLDQVPHGRGVALEVGRTSVALFRNGDQVHALDDMCPHSGGPLSEGALEDGCVSCPWHGARFELSSGRSVGEFTCRDVRRHDVRRVDEHTLEITLAPRTR